MLHDLILAYNFPDNDVIYLFYEIKNTNKRSSPHKKAQKSIKKFVKNDKNMLPSIKFNEIATKSNPFENLDFFESKRKSFSNFSEKSQLELPNNNNSQCNKSFSLYSFSQRIPFKQTENFNSPFSNIRILNINDKTYNNNAENCELSSFLKKNLDYGESFLGISQSYEKKVSKNCNSLINFNESELRALNSEEKIKKNRKDPHHFQKITKIIDSLGNDDTSFATFKKESFPKKIIKFE